MKDHGRYMLEPSPSPEDVIGWLEELAFRSGLIKLDNRFDSSMFSFNPDAPPDLPPPTLEQFLEEEDKEHANVQWMIKQMERHPDLVKKAEEIIEAKLLAAGTSQGKLLDMKKAKLTSVQKFACLYSLMHPLPKAPKKVRIVLLKQTEGGTTMQDRTFSMAETFSDFQHDMHNASSFFNGQGEYVNNIATGQWMYQFVKRDAQGASSVKLEDTDARVRLYAEPDYRTMMRTMMAEGSPAPSALIFQESTILRHEKMREEEKGAEAMWGSVLDEDGTSYFKDVDWNKLDWEKLMVDLCGDGQPLDGEDAQHDEDTKLRKPVGDGNRKHSHRT